MCQISEATKIEFLKNGKREFARVLSNLVVESDHDITICFEFQGFEFLALDCLRLWYGKNPQINILVIDFEPYRPPTSPWFSHFLNHDVNLYPCIHLASDALHIVRSANIEKPVQNPFTRIEISL